MQNLQFHDIKMIASLSNVIIQNPYDINEVMRIEEAVNEERRKLLLLNNKDIFLDIKKKLFEEYQDVSNIDSYLVNFVYQKLSNFYNAINVSEFIFVKEYLGRIYSVFKKFLTNNLGIEFNFCEIDKKIVNVVLFLCIETFEKRRKESEKEAQKNLLNPVVDNIDTETLFRKIVDSFLLIEFIELQNAVMINFLKNLCILNELFKANYKKVVFECKGKNAKNICKELNGKEIELNKIKSIFESIISADSLEVVKKVHVMVNDNEIDSFDVDYLISKNIIMS